MALMFPSKDDVIKSRSYDESSESGFLEISEPSQKYDLLKQWFSRYNSETLEERLVALAIRWADAKNDKSRTRVDKEALQLVRRCCKVRRGFFGEGKEFYRAYWNLRRIYSGQKDFYIGYS